LALVPWDDDHVDCAVAGAAESDQVGGGLAGVPVVDPEHTEQLLALGEGREVVSRVAEQPGRPLELLLCGSSERRRLHLRRF
jgi:hypothetical protein